MGPFPESSKSNNYILSTLGDLTRLLDFVATSNQDAKTVAKVLFDAIINQYMWAKSIVGDLGANYTAEVFKSFCKLLKKLQTTLFRGR